MPETKGNLTELNCRCKKVKVLVHGESIINAECHCKSCREAAQVIENAPNSRVYTEPNGGTRFSLFRKDRVSFVDGQVYLKEMKLKPTAPTRRIIASCCKTPVFLEFKHGHWLSLYTQMWPVNHRPTMNLRTMTSDLENPDELPDDLTNCKRQSFGFMYKLFASWVAMGFRNPSIDCINGAFGDLNHEKT